MREGELMDAELSDQSAADVDAPYKRKLDVLQKYLFPDPLYGSKICWIDLILAMSSSSLVMRGR